MTPRLPLEPLRTFVYVASTGSFKKAADILCISAGAVSQRISQLETHLNAELFARHIRRIHLTQAGQDLLKETKPAIFVIEQALKLETANLVSNIRLETIPSFAAHWLSPNLPEFYSLHPEIQVDISVNSMVVDLNRKDADLAIRYGKDNYPGLCTYQLFSPTSVIICKPDDFVPGERSHFDLCRTLPLLRDGRLTEWEEWLAHNKISEDEITWGPTFSDDALLIQAVKRGQGLAMVREYSAQSSIDAGTVRVLFKTTMENTHGFFLVGLQETFDRHEIKLLRDWLIARFGSQSIGKSEK